MQDKKGYLSESEREYIRKHINENLVKSLRRCFFSPTEEDKENFKDLELLRIIRKVFIPEYNYKDGEIFDNPDTIQGVEPIGFDKETLSMLVKAHLKAKEVINNSILALEGEMAGGNALSVLNITMSIDDKHNAQAIYNRATTIRLIESGLQGLYVISQTAVLTPEEKQVKKTKDSSK